MIRCVQKKSQITPLPARRDAWRNNKAWSDGWEIVVVSISIYVQTMRNGAGKYFRNRF
jgi:hypothetical protein